MRTRFPSALALAALFLPLAALAQKKPSDVPLEDFFKRPQYAQMSLSPDGNKLAALTPLKGRDNLVIVDLEKRTRNIITAFENLDVTGVFWVSSNRLCMRVIDGQVVSGNPVYRGMYCIDANGEDLRNFTTVGTDGSRSQITPLSPMYEESDDYIVAMRQRSRRSMDVYRFNTRTGRYTLLTDDSPGDVIEWVLDRNRVARVAVSYPMREIGQTGMERTATVWLRSGEGAKWEKIAEYKSGWSDSDTFDPVAFDFDNETLYVATNKGRDKEAIFAYDTKNRKMGNLLLEHPLMDVNSGLVFSLAKKKLVGVALNADKPIRVWTDPQFAAVQKGIDAALPKTHNSITYALRNEKKALIYAYSDVDPGTYYLYDADKKGIEPIAKTREWIDPSLMPERKFITYKTRDGVEIPAWVTIPKGGGKGLPLVVNIHGGPWVRSYGWYPWGTRWPEAPFFGSRGYVVLEPEPRGSRGWGRKHLFSSFKQWGLTMQDDLTDGALHLVKEGLVDKNRMCLHGASYGGYATLQGLVKDPGLWKCGSSFLAVTDLVSWPSMTYTDTSTFSDFMQNEFLHMVGDPSKDREYMTRSSPARNADKIKVPVLLAMGGDDVRVPLAHGDMMRSAMQSAGVKHEYVVYNGEGHGFNKDENVFDHYRRVEKFFATYLK
ncbi:MAG TPA: S9 family peptidase [Usitatibacter sp.]|nr:S9 family peptidase [Usitatibacter sp.]HYC51238.1 S9 family peptidase [Gemmatimonadaceae bacterium]